MSRITIDITDKDVTAALQRVYDSGKDMRPFLMAVGETLMASTKRRFETSTDPQGRPWAPNSPVTVERMLDAYKGSRKKSGGLSKKGAARAAAKKPLIGETRALSSTINWQLIGPDIVAIGSPRIYAAMQQFGAAKGQFGSTRRGAPTPWGDIPARPFLGVSAQDSQAILDLAGEYMSL